MLPLGPPQHLCDHPRLHSRTGRRRQASEKSSIKWLWKATPHPSKPCSKLSGAAGSHSASPSPCRAPVGRCPRAPHPSLVCKAQHSQHVTVAQVCLTPWLLYFLLQKRNRLGKEKRPGGSRPQRVSWGCTRARLRSTHALATGSYSAPNSGLTPQEHPTSSRK